MPTQVRKTVVPVEAPEEELDLSPRARQLASTVRQGRLLTISILDEEPITGYLFGWDKDTYFVIQPPMKSDEIPNKHLIPKNSVLLITLHDEKTFREEDKFAYMDDVVKKFREHVNSRYFKSV